MLDVFSLFSLNCCLFSLSDFQVEQIFADDVQVKSWNVFGLPDNRFAIESAVILQLSIYYPLLLSMFGCSIKLKCTLPLFSFAEIRADGR